MKKNIKGVKEIILLISILLLFYIILNISKSFKIIFIILILSFGVLSIIWTLIAKYSLSPKSDLRLFTNNFLACTIAVLSFFIIRLLGDFIFIPYLIYAEFFLIFVTFFFFFLASYYIYKIGSIFGFQRESRNIKNVLKEKKK